MIKCSSLLRAALAFLVAACVARGVDAQDSSLLAQGIDAFNSADFDRSIELLTEVVSDPAETRTDKRQALHYLGRNYVAKDLTDRARGAVTHLLELEPPMVELDPDSEHPDLMTLYYEARKELSGSYQVERPDPGLQTLAVVDFTNSSIDEKEKYDPLRWGLASLMINQLNGATNLKVIERERLRWLLDELELQKNREVVDEQTAVRAGKLMGATSVLFGSFMRVGRDLVITTRLVKVETGEVLLSEQAKGRAGDFLDLATELSRKVADGINANLTLDTSGQSGTKSLDAMISYSEGLKLLDDREYQAAYVKFVEALDYDSEYEQARKRIESLRPLIMSG